MTVGLDVPKFDTSGEFIGAACSRTVGLEIMQRQNTAVYSDVWGNSVELAFPSDAVGDATTVMLTPTLVSNLFGLAFAGHAVDVAAQSQGVFRPDFAFQAPIRMTIHYGDMDIADITNESELSLLRRNGNGWTDVLGTCPGQSDYVREPTENVLRISICRTGRYALFGPTRQVFLSYLAK